MKENEYEPIGLPDNAFRELKWITRKSMCL